MTVCKDGIIDVENPWYNKADVIMMQHDIWLLNYNTMFVQKSTLKFPKIILLGDTSIRVEFRPLPALVHESIWNLQWYSDKVLI